MKCRICGAPASAGPQATIMNRYRITYFVCAECGFMQSEDPYWLDESYSSAISSSDTGVIARNIVFSQISSVILSLLGKNNGRFLDFGGGYGIFTRMMRDKGFDFYWYDKYAQNLVARGFEGSIAGERYEALTSFENFEHLVEPMKELDLMLELTDTILFSTELLPEKIPQPDQWWYYCLEHGQHVSFFSARTLRFIAGSRSLELVSNGKNLHILSKKPINSKIFFMEKVIRFLRCSGFFCLPAKTVGDMHAIIQGQKAVVK
jgi:hypothetical protein